MVAKHYGPSDEEVRRALAANRPQDVDILSEIDRAIVGGTSAQLRVPLDHPVKMAEYAEILEGLGGRLRAICMRRDLPMRDMMMVYKNEIWHTQRAISAIKKGSTRPRLKGVG